MQRMLHVVLRSCSACWQGARALPAPDGFPEAWASPNPKAAIASSRILPAALPSLLCTTSVYEGVPSLVVNLGDRKGQWQGCQVAAWCISRETQSFIQGRLPAEREPYLTIIVRV